MLQRVKSSSCMRMLLSILLGGITLVAIGLNEYEGMSDINQSGVRSILLGNLHALFDNHFFIVLIYLFVIVILTYYFMNKQYFKYKSALITAFLISILTVVGAGYEGTADRSYDLFCGSRSAIIYSIILIAGFTVLYAVIIILIYRFFMWCQSGYSKNENISHINKNKKILFLTIILMLGWSPYLIIFYPGAVSIDESGQLLQMIGQLPMSDHNPFLLSCLMGLCYKVGRILWNANFGVFLYSALQSLTSAFVISYSIWYMERFQCRKAVSILTVLYFILFPLWGSFMQGVQKDTLFTALFLLYIVLVYDMIQNPENNLKDKKKIISLIILSLLLASFRKTGYYVVILTMLFLSIMYRKYFKQLICLLIGIIVPFSIFTHILLPMIGVQQGSAREALSIPFQQTARYVKEYGNEVTMEERLAIDDVLEYELLAKNYVTFISDPIKGTYKESGSEKLTAYFKVWFEQLKKHPGVYINAAMGNMYGYLYPSSFIWGYSYQEIDYGEELDIHFVFQEQVRNVLKNYTELFVGSAILIFLYAPGMYTWL